MTEKTEQQLNWIINNEASYSKEHVQTAHDELKRRASSAGSDKVTEWLEKYWNTLKSRIGFN